MPRAPQPIKKSISNEIQFIFCSKESSESHQCQDCIHHIHAVCGVSSEDNEGDTAIDREREQERCKQQEKWRQETLV